MSDQNKTIGQKAIVIGSSMAGLTAAHVLSKHFDQVTIIERDQLSDSPEPRKGVPQGRQPHALLMRGQLILESYFPGFSDELLAAGAASVNMGSQFHQFMFGKWRTTYDSPLVGISGSRPLIETTVYRHVMTNPKIKFVTQADVIGLCTSIDGKQVTGVTIRQRGQSSSTVESRANETSLDADLVIDASGRESRAPAWLTALGFEAPKETIIDAQPGYAARIYEVPADQQFDWQIQYVMPSAPGGKRGSIIMPMEGNRWHVCMIGMGADYPPTDEGAFLDFARSLPTPDVYNAIKNAIPAGPIIGYRRAENRLRHYHELSRYLEGFVALGDSVYALNPVYGQGMTIAAIASTVLDEALVAQLAKAGLAGFAENFQKELVKVITGPWQLATNEDLRWIANAQIDFPTRMIQKYFEQVLRAMMTDQEVAEAFLRVQNMLDKPTVLFNPRIMARVLRANRRQANQSKKRSLMAASL